MLQGVTVLLPPSTSIGSHRAARVGAWRRALEKAGGRFTERQCEGVTHVLVDNSWQAVETPTASSALGAAAQRVHYSWLADCLLQRRRLPEQPYSQAALAAAAAEHAAIAVKAEELTIDDVQQLLSSLVLGGPQPAWAHVPVPAACVLLVFVPGLDRQAAGSALSMLRQRVSLLATHRNEVPSQTTASLLTMPQAGGAAKKRKHLNHPPTAAPQPQATTARELGAADEDLAAGPFPPEFYAATRRQMAACGYPLAAAATSAAAAHALPPGYASTEQERAALEAVGERAQPRDLVAVDCEMVITAHGFELARVSLVDGRSGAVLMDEFVIPDNPIVDYNTKNSGIDAATLAGVRTTVAQARRAVCRYVGPATLLVGHTLENDLKVLRLVHSRCIETSLLYMHPRGLPHRLALRTLARQHLGLTIQSGAHDSTSDARATLRLAARKLAHGPTYGGVPAGRRHFLEAVQQAGLRLALVDRRDVLNQHAVAGAALTECSTDAEAVGQVELLLAAQPTPRLVVTSLSDFYEHLEDRAAAAADQAQTGAAGLDAALETAHRDEALLRLLREVQAHLGRLHAALPPGGVLLAVSGGGDAPLVRALLGETTSARKEAAAEQNARRAAGAAHAGVQALMRRAAEGVLAVG